MNKIPFSTNAAVLKQHLPTYLELIGPKPIMRATKTDLRALCPLHDDQNPSLTAKKKENAWVWYCHPCEAGGTVIELHALRRKLDPKTQLPVICREVAEILNGAPAKPPMIDQPTNPLAQMSPGPVPERELTALTSSWRKTLCEDASLRDQFASELGLQSNILQWAANNAQDGLGIAPVGYKWETPAGKVYTLREPRLVYIGAGYFKIRSPFGNEAVPRFWMAGQQSRPWLGQSLVPGDPTVKHVHLHESESSALALIAAGFWTSDHSSIVVATSGAGGFNREWCPLFAGRTVHFWPDADAAGMRFAHETAGLLHGTANEILFHDWHPESTTPKP